MKAKVKATGQIIELNDEKLSLLDYARGIYRDTEGNKFHRKELEFIKNKDGQPIDWEQRRYEIAKSVLQGFCANSEPSIAQGTTFQQIAGWSIELADILIAELKKDNIKF